MGSEVQSADIRIILICGVSFVAGLVFLIVGAWPVIGFFGLDVLLVYWAFRVNYRCALAYEEVTVTPTELRVRKVSHRGKVAEWTLNPVWVRLDRDTARGVRHRAAVSGLAWPAASDCGLSGPAGEGKLRGRAVGGDRRGQARADPHRALRVRTLTDMCEEL